MLHAGEQAWLGAPLGTLDRARARVLKRTMPLSGVLAADRELRVGVLGVAAVTLALLFTLTVPAWLLLLGPLLLGVPHLLADVRYGVVRNGLLSRTQIFVPAALAVTLAGVLGMVAFGFAGAFAVLVLGWERQGRRWSAVRAVALTLTLAMCMASFVYPRAAGLLMAHAHNLVAVLLWWLWRRRENKWHYLVLLLIGAGLLLIAALPLDVVTLATRSPVALEIETQADLLSGGQLSARSHSLAPVAGLALPADLGLRLVLGFCFLQSVHYSMWLGLIREEDRVQRTPRTFRASLRGLIADLGWPLLIGSLGLALFVATWGYADPLGARSGYLHFARFHGSLELCALALIVAAGRPASSETYAAAAYTRTTPFSRRTRDDSQAATSEAA